jgi:hypothetical protein
MAEVLAHPEPHLASVQQLALRALCQLGAEGSAPVPHGTGRLWSLTRDGSTDRSGVGSPIVASLTRHREPTYRTTPFQNADRRRRLQALPLGDLGAGAATSIPPAERRAA